MGRTVKIHGFDSPRLGRLDDSIVVRWKEALLIAFPGTRVWEYLDRIPSDDWDVDYSPALFTRFTPHIEYQDFWIADYLHCQYWDAVIVVGLHPGVVVALPSGPETLKGLLMGKERLHELYPELRVLRQNNWISKVQWPVTETMQIPEVNWQRHNF